MFAHLTRNPAHVAKGAILLLLLGAGLTGCGDDTVTAPSTARRVAPTAAAHTIKIDYPLAGAIFPPEFIPPLFLWHDDAETTDAWHVRVTFADGEVRLLATTDGPPPPRGRIDPDARGPTNSLYEPTAYQASAHSWRPSASMWTELKRRSVDAAATITVEGFERSLPGQPLSRGEVAITTSKDPVGAPIFYRDVPLMPARGEKGRIKPLSPNAVPLIGWRLRDVGHVESRLLLTGMPSCANCHSFSADGKTLGIDVDGPDGDKGSYALTTIQEHTQIQPEHILSWNDFPEKPKGHHTLGFLSRVSPDGRYAITTLNEQVYIANFLDYRFLQVFYPTRGILALYDRTTGKISSLPGANDPAYVHCDPVWSPDGKTIVFARAPAKDPYEEGRPLATYPNDPNEIQIQYNLMRMPFNEGHGGKAVRVEGASDNGMSNTFPKISPDARWIVYTKCRNGQLMRPDGRLWIVPLEGGEARELSCNLPVMNSWHSFSPNGHWLVFSSKSHTPYTQMFLTHLDKDGNASPPIYVEGSTAANRAVNIPEFVNIPYDALRSIEVPAVSHYLEVQRGVDLLEHGDFDGAFAAFERALQKSPDYARAHTGVGRILSERGKLADAVAYYRSSVQAHPRDPAVHLRLGFALALKGDANGALASYEEALRIDPQDALAHNNLGAALQRLERHEEALQHLQQAVALDPQLVFARKNLGFALLRANRLDKAAAQYQAALTQAPEDVVAHSSLSRIRFLQGRNVEAMEHLQRVVALDGRDLHSLRVLAWQLATSPDERVRDGKRAVELAQRALVLSAGRTALMLDILAAAHAEAGNYETARKTAAEALAIAVARKSSSEAGIRKRAEGYRADRPYRSVPLQQPAR